jgi:hypothetical protein
MRVEYSIALDSDYAVWSAFANRYWPAVYLADAVGRIRYQHFGEGEYDEGEWMIQHLLRDAAGEGIDNEPVSVAPDDSRRKPTGRTCALRDLPRLRTGAEPRLSRGHRVRRASQLCRARVIAAKHPGPGPETGRSGGGRAC